MLICEPHDNPLQGTHARLEGANPHGQLQVPEAVVEHIAAAAEF